MDRSEAYLLAALATDAEAEDMSQDDLRTLVVKVTGRDPCG